MDWLPLGKWWHPRIRTPSQWHEKSCRNLVCPPQARCTPWKYWSRCLFHSFCSCWCRFWSSWSTSCRLSMEHTICSKTTCNKHLCLWQSVWWTPPNQSKLILLWGTFHNSACTENVEWFVLKNIINNLMVAAWPDPSSLQRVWLVRLLQDPLLSLLIFSASSTSSRFDKFSVLIYITSSWRYHPYFKSSFGAVCLQYALQGEVLVCDCLSISELFMCMV